MAADRRWTVPVESSDGSKTYEVVLELHGDDVYASCTCQAGQRQVWCKHRRTTIARLPVDFPASRLGDLLEERNACDRKYRRLERELKEAKAKERDAIEDRMAEWLPRPGNL